MELRKKKLCISEAKEIDMVHFLSKLGYEPAYIRNCDYWYLSPIRSENTPSFKVNKNLNRWYDHGLGKGGNVVDFGVLYWNCEVGEVLNKFSGDFSFQQHAFQAVETTPKRESKIKVTDDFLLSSDSLLCYLQNRCIPIEIASDHCREVRYEINGKTWYAIGFKNDLGGYELRSTYHKLSSSPKGITTIKNGANYMAVFEGFFDFLSYLVISENGDYKSKDYIILNSVSFLQKSTELLNKYQVVSLFLDNDSAGQIYTNSLTDGESKYFDKSSLYTGYDDLNHWLVNSPEAEKHRIAVKVANSIFDGKPPDR